MNFKTSIYPTTDNSYSLGSASMRWKINGKDMLDMMYPVGSIYMSMASTSPSILFGGTWEQISGKFLLACDTTYEAGSEGGSASNTLVIDNLPSHSHTMGAHSHGLNGHTHTVGAHSHSLASHTHYVPAQNGGTYDAGNHRHQIRPVYDWDMQHAGWTFTVNSLGTYTHNTLYSEYSGTHSHSVWTNAVWSQGPSTNTSGDSAAFNSGAASGSTANSTAFDSGSIGSGTSFTNMPPYIAVYIWQRTA